MVIKLKRTTKRYRPLRYSPRSVYVDPKTGIEYVKLGGKTWKKNALEGYNLQ